MSSSRRETVIQPHKTLGSAEIMVVKGQPEALASGGNNDVRDGHRSLCTCVGVGLSGRTEGHTPSGKVCGWPAQPSPQLPKQCQPPLVPDKQR